MLTRCVLVLRVLLFQRRVSAGLAGFLIFAASPLWAQTDTFEPTVSVGGGIQTSYQHTEPMSAATSTISR